MTAAEPIDECVYRCTWCGEYVDDHTDVHCDGHDIERILRTDLEVDVTAAERPVLFAPRPPDPTHPLWCATCGHEDLQHVHPATTVAAEPTPAVDLRTRIAAAFEAEDSRNWGYDHDFAADDAETLAFADVAIAVMGGELADLRAENERLRRERADFRAACKSVGDRATKAKAERDEARAETKAVRAIAGGWISDANDGYGSDPNDLAGLLDAHDASGAPESPADATASRETPDA